MLILKLATIASMAFLCLVAVAVAEDVRRWWRGRKLRRAGDRARMRASANGYLERRGDLVTMEERRAGRARC